MDAHIKTRILILSDTHGVTFSPEDRPLQCADVALHCGDLTNESKLEEFHDAIRLLKDIDAPIKLVIAGNHDFTMDVPAFKAKVADADTPLDPSLVAREYGTPGEVRRLFDDARDTGIIFLDEGTHRIPLKNGALLTIFTSPYTPSMGVWGFQYNPNHGRKFTIEKGTDIVMTHGPPKGVLDLTYSLERAGCPDLFTAVANARPRLHCFGHIHEGWGARLVTWKPAASMPNATHFSAIDNELSPSIEKLATLREGKYDSDETKEEKRRKVFAYSEARCVTTSHCLGDEHPLQVGAKTLFVNAAIEEAEDFVQRPWIVDMELPASRGS